MTKADPSDIYSVIANYPQQFEKGFRLAETIQLPSDINNIVIISMGYDASSAKILVKLLKDKITVPIAIHQSDQSPHNISNTSLVLFIDSLVNTPEILSVFKKIDITKTNSVVITSDRELEIQAREKNIPFVLVPKAPKITSGYIIAIIAQLLINAGITTKDTRQQILEAADSLNKLYLPQQGKKIAELIKKHTLLIYASEDYWPLALMTKNQVNNIAKTPCFWNRLPEINYNEILSLNNLKKNQYYALVFQNSETPTPFTETLSELKILHRIIPMLGKNKLEKTLSSLMLIDWIAYWLALDKRLDPAS